MGHNVVVVRLMVGTHAILHITNGIIDITVQPLLGNLTGILAAQLLNLCHRGSFLQQARGNVCL